MESDQGGYRQINKSLNICAFSEYLNGQTASLPRLESVEQLSPLVLRVLGQNAGKFTLQGTNTFIVGSGRERLLIDTSGGEPEWASLIARTLQSMNISLSHVLLTHWHGDHTGGVPDLIRMYPHLTESIYKNDPESGQQAIDDQQIFRVEGATVRALHVPGHSEDHMCFILEEENAMFTGDNVLGHGTSAVEDLATFMNSLRRMWDQKCKAGYPAHGVKIEDLSLKIGRELGQKYRREQQTVRALKEAAEAGIKSETVKELVTRIYGEKIDGELRSLALEPFLDEVLRKLADDGKVAFELRRRVKHWYLVDGVRFKAPITPPTMEKSVLVTVQTASAVWN